MNILATLSLLSTRSAPILLLAGLAVTTAPAQDAVKNSIQQSAADQQELRRHTDILSAQIQALIGELSDNGISGADVKTLTTTKAILNNLTTQEMQRVIASLQKASQTAGTSSGEQNLVEAYGAQKGIILQFRQILNDYEQRQAGDQLPDKFKELTDRQTQIMWSTVQVASDIAGKGRQQQTTLQQTTSQIVQADQSALTNDVAMAGQMLDKAAQNSSGEQGTAMQQARQDFTTGKVQDNLTQANTDLAAGHLLQATTLQKAARDVLRQVTRDLNPPTTTVNAMSDFAAGLDKLIDAEKDLLNQTNAAQDVKPRTTGLDSKQGLIVDQTDSLVQDMQNTNPTAAGLVKGAITPMQQARAILRSFGGKFANAAISEQAAIDQLETADKQLNQDLADAQKAADAASKNAAQNMQDLQNQIQQAEKQQQQITQAGSAGQQAQQQLQQATQTLQQTASPLSLAAAQALANAQQAMQQAQQAMNNSQPQQAQQDQQQATQDLQQANQAVQQAVAQSQQQAPDSAQLAQAANDLQQAQNAVSTADASAQQQANSQQASGQQANSQPADAQPAGGQQQTGTPQAGGQQQANSQPASGQPQAAAPQAGGQQASGQQAGAQTMAQAQQALNQAAQAAQAAGQSQGLPAGAQNAVQQAQQDIAQGQQAAGQNNAQATAAAAAAAQTALAQAQAAVAMAQAGMASSSPTASGAPPPGPPMPGQPGMMPTPPGPDTPSVDGAQTITGGGTEKGALHDVSGTGKFITVMSRERSAISETQAEPRPQEYAPMIDQYLKNLSDQATAAPAH